MGNTLGKEESTNMTDEEFDIIDELYFVTSYQDLKEGCQFSDEILQSNLVSLIENGLVRVYKDVDEASEMEDVNLKDHFRDYFYLASKKGLFEHNSK
ncbi:MAG: hypothetical protein AB8B73_08245 [Ekhidna sp.]